jgi:hypothetical protein
MKCPRKRTGLFERRWILHLPLFSTDCFWDSFTVEGVDFQNLLVEYRFNGEGSGKHSF